MVETGWISRPSLWLTTRPFKKSPLFEHPQGPFVAWESNDITLGTRDNAIVHHVESHKTDGNGLGRAAVAEGEIRLEGSCQMRDVLVSIDNSPFLFLSFIFFSFFLYLFSNSWAGQGTVGSTVWGGEWSSAPATLSHAPKWRRTSERSNVPFSMAGTSTSTFYLLTFAGCQNTVEVRQPRRQLFFFFLKKSLTQP